MQFDAAAFLASLFSDSQESPLQTTPVVVPNTAHDVPMRSANVTETVLQWLEPGEDASPPPCPTCGSSDLWETIVGTWRCQHCDAAAQDRSRRLRQKAAWLRLESFRRMGYDRKRTAM